MADEHMTPLASVSLSQQLDPWASGVLDPEVHDRLVANLDQVARRSGLGDRYKHLIWTATDEHLVAQMELEWAKAAALFAKTKVWSFEHIGIAYPPNTPHIQDRMRQLCARLLRNFVDVRFLSLAEIISERKLHGSVEGTCILCPDLIIPEYLTTMSDWDRKEIIGFIKDRTKDGLPTSVYVGVPLVDLLHTKTKFPSVAMEIQSAFMTPGGKH